MEYIPFYEKHYFEFCWSLPAEEHKTLPKMTRRNLKLNKLIYIWNPMTTA